MSLIVFVKSSIAVCILFSPRLFCVSFLRELGCSLMTGRKLFSGPCKGDIFLYIALWSTSDGFDSTEG